MKAGASLSVGVNNVILGGYTGAASQKNALAVYSADGERGIHWLEGNASGVQTISSGSAPTLDENETLAMTYDDTEGIVRFHVRHAGATDRCITPLASTRADDESHRAIRLKVRLGHGRERITRLRAPFRLLSWH